MTRQLTVGLLWHSLDSSNLGVGALTHAQVHLVREAARVAGVEVVFVVMGWTKDGASAADPGVVQVCQVNGRRLLGQDRTLREALARCSLVLDIGEGDSFSDIYGWRRLVYLIGTKLLASRDGRALVFSPQTLGPFKSRVAAFWADVALRRATLVCTRDALSSTFFASRNLPGATIEVTDVAFALPYRHSPDTQPRPRPLVGVNVSGLLWSGGYTGANQFGLKLDYRQLVLDLVDWFTGPGGADVVLVPHVVTPKRLTEDDWRAGQQLQAARPAVQLAGPFATPMLAKGFISGLDFFVGARMHACIAAVSSGVPCVPTAYSRKFSGLFNSLDYPHVADCTKLDAAQVLDQIARAYAQRQDLKTQALAAQHAASQRLMRYRDALVPLLQGKDRHG